jgi:hypothetical protein
MPLQIIIPFLFGIDFSELHPESDDLSLEKKTMAEVIYLWKILYGFLRFVIPKQLLLFMVSMQFFMFSRPTCFYFKDFCFFSIKVVSFKFPCDKIPKI